MSTARKFFAAAVIAGCCTTAVLAEVSAETDVFGNYVRTIVSSSTSTLSIVKTQRIWTVSRVRPTFWPLNPTGDFTGDLWPYIAESPVQSRWPWVTWSKFNGSDYDLAWSRWTGRGWTPVAMVEAIPGTDDALDSAVAFDQVGRAYLVWGSKPRS